MLRKNFTSPRYAILWSFLRFFQYWCTIPPITIPENLFASACQGW